MLLHYNCDCNTNDIWRAAIRRKWETERVHDKSNVKDIVKNRHSRYYGNVLQSNLKDFPFKFYPIDLNVLAKTPLTKRKIALARFGDLSPFNRPMFIKPAQEKWFAARVYQAGELPAAEGSKPDDFVYVQEPVKMINEVRCFCLNGEILTASYYRIGHEYCPLGLDEVDRPAVLDEMAKELSPMYPNGVVLDFAYDGSQWMFIEPNEAWASGLYGCCPDKCLDVIVASQYDV